MSADTLRPCAIDCDGDCAATPRGMCPTCRRYPCADLLDTCGLCALASANGVPTVPAPRPSLVEQYLAAQRVADESIDAAAIAMERAGSVRSRMSAAERAEADQRRGEMRREQAARRMAVVRTR